MSDCGVEIVTSSSRSGEGYATLYSGGWEGPLPREGESIVLQGPGFGPSEHLGEEDATQFKVTDVIFRARTRLPKGSVYLRPHVTIWVELDEEASEYRERCECEPGVTQKGLLGDDCDECGKEIR